MLQEYFQELGFTKKETQVFEALYRLGTKPASIVAKYLGLERTSVYKILQRLSEENLVFETYKGGIKHFFIPGPDVLKKYTTKKTQKYTELTSNYDLIEKELQELEGQKDNSIPKISLFDGIQGIENMHQDILDTALALGYISIRLFASNTVDSQVTLSSRSNASSQKLFQSLTDNNISVETFLGNGIMLMETISKTYDIDTLSKLPASNSAVNLYLVGSTIYIIIFKDSPFGIKIQSDDLAQTFHFLFDKIEYKY